jgi:hypothetical protein
MRRPRDVKQFIIRGRLCRRLAHSAALGCASRRTPRRLRDQRIRIAPELFITKLFLRRQVGHHATSVFTYVCERTRHERDEKTGQRVLRVKGQGYPFAATVWRSRWNDVRTVIPNGEDLNPHRIRASAITLMLNLTGNVELVRLKVGHADIKTTLSYVSVLPRNARDAAERAERTDPGLRSIADIYMPARHKPLKVVD